MKNNDLVTFEIAKLAKEQGLKQNKLAHYYSIEGTLEHEEMSIAINYCDAPTYHQLIDWIFEQNNKVDCSVFVEQAPKKEIEIQRGWLKIWYDTLKDCPLKGEFKGRLMEWFRQLGYEIDIYRTMETIKSYNYGVLVEYWGADGTDELSNMYYKDYIIAEHQSILHTFKHIQVKYNIKDNE